MSLSDRGRKRGTASAQKLLPPGTTIRQYVVGRANARMSTGAILAICGFGMVFLVALALGIILLPGGLLLLYILQALRPPRALIVADKGVALLDRSFISSRPTKVLAYLPLDVIPRQTTLTGSTQIALGPDLVTFPKAEFQRLTAAVETASA